MRSAPFFVGRTERPQPAPPQAHRQRRKFIVIPARLSQLQQIHRPPCRRKATPAVSFRRRILRAVCVHGSRAIAILGFARSLTAFFHKRTRNLAYARSVPGAPVVSSNGPRQRERDRAIQPAVQRLPLEEQRLFVIHADFVLRPAVDHVGVDDFIGRRVGHLNRQLERPLRRGERRLKRRHGGQSGFRAVYQHARRIGDPAQTQAVNVARLNGCLRLDARAVVNLARERLAQTAAPAAQGGGFKRRVDFVAADAHVVDFVG